jgi:VanZ family protein
MIALILFSSSSAASRFCDGLFYSNVYFFGAARNHHGLLSAIHFILEKGMHLVLFLIFGHLLMLSANGSYSSRVVFVLASGLILGTAAEFLQTFFVGRDPTVRDTLIDFAGASLGVVTATQRSRRSCKDTAL